MTSNDGVQRQSVNAGSSESTDSSRPVIAEKLSKNVAEAEIALTVGEDTIDGNLNEKGDALDEEEREWENDPENARNWPPHKKWAAIFVVRPLLFMVSDSRPDVGDRPVVVLYVCPTFGQLHDGSRYS